MRDLTMSFSARVSEYQGSTMLNICDYNLLGNKIGDGEHEMHISEGYYGGKIVSTDQATELLQNSSIINLVGPKIVSLAIDLGCGYKRWYTSNI